MYSRYQCKHCYKYENDEEQRILSGKCTVLCYILEYIHVYINIVQKAKRQTSPVLAFNMQTRPNILPDLVFACWKQAHDLCVSLLFVQYRYIPICNTKQYIYKTNYALCNHSRTYNKVYCWYWKYMYVIRSFKWTAFTSPASSVGRASDFIIWGLWVRVPLWARIFHFVFCRFRRAPDRSTGPMQMKSSMTSIRSI